MASAPTPKGKAAGSTPVWDMLQKREGHFSLENVSRVFFLDDFIA